MSDFRSVISQEIACSEMLADQWDTCLLKQVRYFSNLSNFHRYSNWEQNIIKMSVFFGRLTPTIYFHV